jgi:hypothetical protein
MRCRVCTRVIRGTAGTEEYDETTQTMKFTCKRCVTFFNRLTQSDTETRALLQKDPATPLRFYHQVISTATGIVAVEALKAIEDTMRHEIFHSTLDWQTRAQLERGARQAARLLGLR